MGNKAKKIVILLFVFVLIPLVYLFLQSFGENQFVLKTYYQEEVPALETPCAPIQAPYAVSPTLWADAAGEEATFPNAHINLVLKLHPEQWRVQMNHLNSLQEAFAEKADIEILVLAAAADSLEQQGWEQRLRVFKEQTPHWYLHTTAGYLIDQYFTCTLLSDYSNPDWEDISPGLPASSVAVLLDRENRIRGYFNLTETPEYDRLVIEVGVMLLEYKQASK